ncbi:helix-turn-helix transcriptional regulator [Lentzea aerocolonigenes]|uniref:helix-turn-helix transcriptional regulator n=1 Tax=Lentzea aerocolonigenes TaxID=68170 RepID=UPI0004C34111|nr:helix-turn-helix transcriptional regulator [Lentzea aerocolonigenes]MCP2241478.1 DNA-binding transcriptional regulator, CsgD family [Lentzea aerocolonigenes]
MWEGRAHGVRRDVTALASAGLDVAELHAAAIALVDRVVPCELTCWASMDPDSGAISSMTSGVNRIPAQYEPVLASCEYTPGEPHTFAALAQRGDTVARLEDKRSTRLNEVWRPLGLSHELRVLFRADHTCWGAAGVVRTSEFSEREVEFLASVAPALGAATRLAARTGARRSHPLHDAPAIIVVATDGTIRASTASATRWRDELEEVAPGRFAVMLRAAAAGARTGAFKARVRDAHGGWILLEASELLSDDSSEAAVTISRASGAELMGLLLKAHGVTAREQDVCHEVLAGQPTSEIAARLDISPYTVQDHLKSLFAKFGVRSRAELVAKLS